MPEHLENAIARNRFTSPGVMPLCSLRKSKAKREGGGGGGSSASSPKVNGASAGASCADA